MARLKTDACFIVDEIDNVLGNLRKIRGKVSARDKRRIDLEIRELKSIRKKVRIIAHIPPVHGRIYFSVRK
jgi:hypothetical protein